MLHLYLCQKNTQKTKLNIHPVMMLVLLWQLFGALIMCLCFYTCVGYHTFWLLHKESCQLGSFCKHGTGVLYKYRTHTHTCRQTRMFTDRDPVNNNSWCHQEAHPVSILNIPCKYLKHINSSIKQ